MREPQPGRRRFHHADEDRNEQQAPEEGGPVQARRQAAEIGGAPGVVRLVDILAGGAVEMGGGDLRLKRDDAVRPGFGFGSKVGRGAIRRQS